MLKNSCVSSPSRLLFMIYASLPTHVRKLVSSPFFSRLRYSTLKRNTNSANNLTSYASYPTAYTIKFIHAHHVQKFVWTHYSLWESPDAFNCMITAVHCEGTKQQIQDNVQLTCSYQKQLKTTGRVPVKGLGSNSLNDVLLKRHPYNPTQNLAIQTLDQNKRF